ncbi:penicillin-binding transpeptidase domain-containing protein, partial [Thermocatellispora tengchongensis]|uniref:penicillin-binding transpeptidase domain-containing protein n=1 Tax=Thermocatellispora tengchongensis TaxID=1073253 RepID=UPI0031E8F08F
YWSINTATAAQASQLDLCDIADATERLHLVDGVTGEPQNPANPSFSLGTTNVTPLAQASAFAALANEDEYCAPRALLSVKDAAGNKYKVPGEDCEDALEPDVVANLNGTLSKIAGQRIAKGTINVPIAGKTGTNNGASSTWFVGYTTGVAVPVLDRRGHALAVLAVVVPRGSDLLRPAVMALRTAARGI